VIIPGEVLLTSNPRYLQQPAEPIFRSEDVEDQLFQYVVEDEAEAIGEEDYRLGETAAKAATDLAISAGVLAVHRTIVSHVDMNTGQEVIARLIRLYGGYKLVSGIFYGFAALSIGICKIPEAKTRWQAYKAKPLVTQRGLDNRGDL